MPEHEMVVGRMQIGMTALRPQRPRYGTTVRCTCGWRPDRSSMGGRASNSPPSRGGRADARRMHAAHVAEATSYEEATTAAERAAGLEETT